MVHDHPHKHSVSVSAIIFNDQRDVLITQRRDTGAWVPPGGVLHLHEPIEDGLRREVREETGLEIEIERLSGVYKNTATGVISLAFRCHVTGSMAPRTSSETMSIQWITNAEADARIAEPFLVRIRNAQLVDRTYVTNFACADVMNAK